MSMMVARAPIRLPSMNTSLVPPARALPQAALLLRAALRGARALYPRSPKMALPTLTIVAPSSMATS
jgi:hypothetical protein